MSVSTGAFAWLNRVSSQMGIAVRGALLATAPLYASFSKIASGLFPATSVEHRLIPVRSSRDAEPPSSRPTQITFVSDSRLGVRGHNDGF